MDKTDRQPIILKEYLFSSFSYGMMFQSDSAQSERVFRQDGYPLLSVTTRPAFRDETENLYRLTEEQFAHFQALVNQTDLLALADLKANAMPPIMDHSSNASCSFVIDTPDRTNVTVQLTPVALYANGFGSFLDSIHQLVAQLRDAESPVKTTVTPRNGSPAVITVNDPAFEKELSAAKSADKPVPSPSAQGSKPSVTEWKCNACGHVETSDQRFCPACGCRRY